MADRTPAYRDAVRTAGEWVNSFTTARHFDEGFKVTCLERALEAQREAARLEAEFIDALTPCRMCGRKVTSPCNDAEGYYEGGPWDASCEGYARAR